MGILVQGFRKFKKREPNEIKYIFEKNNTQRNLCCGVLYDIVFDTVYTVSYWAFGTTLVLKQVILWCWGNFHWGALTPPPSQTLGVIMNCNSSCGGLSMDFLERHGLIQR